MSVFNNFYIRYFAFFFFLNFIFIHTAAGASGKTEDYPNLIIIMADDLGWGDVGYHGSKIKTPNIDRLASEGVILNRFYAYPVCSPSRSALMTGMSPLRSNIVGAISKGRPKPSLSHMFFPEVLHQAGYQNWMIGKWHLGGELSVKYLPTNRGFDHFYGHIGGGVDHYSHSHWRTDQPDWYKDGSPVVEEGYTSTLLTDYAVKKILERDKSRPFFMLLSYSAPHRPLQAPDNYLLKYNDMISMSQKYAAMVDYMDHSIGRLISTVEADSQSDDTIILFMSDNGGTLFGGASNKPLRGQKFEYFEGATRVPAFIKWPKNFQQEKSLSSLFLCWIGFLLCLKQLV